MFGLKPTKALAGIETNLGAELRLDPVDFGLGLKPTKALAGIETKFTRRWPMPRQCSDRLKPTKALAGIETISMTPRS